MSDRIITEQLAKQIAGYLQMVARDRPFAEVHSYLAALEQLPPAALPGEATSDGVDTATGRRRR